MLGKLLFHIIAGALGIWLAVRFVPGVAFIGPIKDLLIAGAVMGLINFFIKPALKMITLPLRILTLGLFSLVINMFSVWLVDIFFGKEFEISGIVSLFWTTLIIWALSYIFGLLGSKKK
jgi:putative membrane protein